MSSSPISKSLFRALVLVEFGTVRRRRDELALFGKDAFPALVSRAIRSWRCLSVNWLQVRQAEDVLAAFSPTSA
jgi:hypothetical protein